MSYFGRTLHASRRRRELIRAIGSWTRPETRSSVVSVATVVSEPARFEKCGSVTVIRVGPDEGSLEVEQLDRLRHEVLGSAQEAIPPRIVIDLEATKYFGGEFMGILCRCLHKVRGRGGEFALCGARPQLLEALHVARFDDVCEIYSNRAEAVDALDRAMVEDFRQVP